MSLSVTRPERTVEFCTNLGLQSAHEDAVRALERARKAAVNDPRESGAPGLRDAAEAVQKVEEEMRSHTVVFTLRAWPRKRWAEFEETHPPRKDNETDKTVGLDISTLDEAIAGSIVSVRSVAGEDVEFDAATEWQPLADEMTNGQWQEFATAILNVNRGVKEAPFSAAASRVIRISERNSK